MPADIIHPVLGTLTLNADLYSWDTKIELHSGCTIDLCLTTLRGSPPTDNIDALFQSGVEMLKWGRRMESECRERIADELLELYNGTWAPEDATIPMGRAEFISRIAPSALVRDIDGSGFFYWDDDDMFAGHWIELRFRKDHTVFEVSLAG